MKTIPFIVVASLVFVLSFFGSHPAITLILGTASLLFAAVLLAASYAELPYCWGTFKRAESARARRMSWFIICGCVVLTLTAVTIHWPLRVSYAFSKSSLNKIAKQVSSGSKASAPQSVGIFEVKQADVDKGLVCLWIDEDRGEQVGFVQGAPNKIQARFSGYDVVVLDDNWCLVASL